MWLVAVEVEHLTVQHLHAGQSIVLWHTRLATLDDKYIGLLSELVLHSWPSTEAEVQKDLQPYWSFRDKIAIIDGIAVKGRRIIIPAAPQYKAACT